VAVREVELSKADIATADDVFLTNSLIGMWPVNQVEDQQYTRSDVAREIAAGLLARGVIECAP